jgi:hypothetical protein
MNLEVLKLVAVTYSVNSGDLVTFSAMEVFDLVILVHGYEQAVRD